MTTNTSRELSTGGRHPFVVTETGDGSVVLERFLDAPRDLVFRVMTDPALVPEWWGPRSLKTEVVEMDVRVGGRWAFNNIDADGNVYEFRGEYLAIDPPNSITQTFEFMGAPGMVSTEHLTLVEDPNGGTRIRVTADYGSAEAAAAVVSSGMEQGASETYDRLEEVLDRELARA